MKFINKSMTTDRDITDAFYDPASAHPITGATKQNGGDKGFFQKAIEFAKENPILTVMAGLFVLGLVLPGKKK